MKLTYSQEKGWEVDGDLGFSIGKGMSLIAEIALACLAAIGLTKLWARDEESRNYVDALCTRVFEALGAKIERAGEIVLNVATDVKVGLRDARDWFVNGLQAAYNAHAPQIRRVIVRFLRIEALLAIIAFIGFCATRFEPSYVTGQTILGIAAILLGFIPFAIGSLLDFTRTENSAVKALKKVIVVPFAGFAFWVFAIAVTGMVLPPGLAAIPTLLLGLLMFFLVTAKNLTLGTTRVWVMRTVTFILLLLAGWQLAGVWLPGVKEARAYVAEAAGYLGLETRSGTSKLAAKKDIEKKYNKQVERWRPYEVKDLDQPLTVGQFILKGGEIVLVDWNMVGNDHDDIAIALKTKAYRGIPGAKLYDEVGPIYLAALRELSDDEITHLFGGEVASLEKSPPAANPTAASFVPPAAPQWPKKIIVPAGQTIMPPVALRLGQIVYYKGTSAKIEVFNGGYDPAHQWWASDKGLTWNVYGQGGPRVRNVGTTDEYVEISIL